MSFSSFIANHIIFTTSDIKKYFKERYHKTSSVKNMLLYHKKQGHICHIRKGLYYVIPKGYHPDSFPIDSYLVASRMTEDAILGYHTALGYFGKLHSVRNDFVYFTKQKLKPPFHFRGETYVGVSVPEKIKKSSTPNIGVLSLDRSGHFIRVTSLERTVVDILDRPQLVGNWEEIWRSLEVIEYLDLDQVLEYALTLGNATTIAKTAFFLETHQKSLMVPKELLQQLSQHIPSEAHYLSRHSDYKQKLITRWNLIVPENIINRTWEEPYEDI